MLCDGLDNNTTKKELSEIFPNAVEVRLTKGYACSSSNIKMTLVVSFSNTRSKLIIHVLSVLETYLIG